MDPKMLCLIRQLHAQCQAGTLQWEEGGDEGTTSIGGYAIGVSQEDDDVYVLTIYDDSDDVVEAVQVGATGEDGDGDVHRLLAEIWKLAGRQARGIDQAIDAILSEL